MGKWCCYLTLLHYPALMAIAVAGVDRPADAAAAIRPGRDRVNQRKQININGHHKLSHTISISFQFRQEVSYSTSGSSSNSSEPSSAPTPAS
jgi:hypothetical protein